MKKKELTLKEACKKKKIKYSEAMRLVDFAKQIGKEYKDGITLEELMKK